MSEVTRQLNLFALSKCPAEDPSSIGNLLQAYFKLSPGQIMEAVALQVHNPDLRMGDAIVMLGYADKEKVDKLLAKQEDLRKGEADVSDLGKLADWVAERLLGR